MSSLIHSLIPSYKAKGAKDIEPSVLSVNAILVSIHLLP